MPVKTYKPYTPSRRRMSRTSQETLTGKKPEKSLLKPLKQSGGRNHHGRTTVRFRGGRHKRRYRTIDFRREKFGVPARVHSLEYDPNRSCHIALLFYRDGEKRYIIAPEGVKPGTTVMSGPGSPLLPGNCLPLREIPEGVEVHNIELYPKRGGQMARSAGTFATILSKEGKYAFLQLPSTEVRLVNLECMATVGRISNPDHELINMGKAGRKRWLGRKPHVRGVVMNPVDHPLGGGEGRSKGGRPPASPWGTIAKGKKTRKKRKPSSKFIIRSRRKKRG
jgi:large subunit ribosomal protein L2